LIVLLASRFRVAALIAAALLLFAACGGDAADDLPEEGTGEEAGLTLQVTTVDNSFDPATLMAVAGTPVTIVVTNNGSNPHTFTIDDLEVDTGTIAAGESASETFIMPETSVTFYCAIHGEAAMSGAIEPTT
jgi:plastocyanin